MPRRLPPSPQRLDQRLALRAAGCALLVWAVTAGFGNGSAPAWAANLSQPTENRNHRQLEPSYWRERIFFIPFQPDPQQFLAGSTRVVRLLMSRDGVRWQVLQEARPGVRGFSFHAPGDGEYFFAVQVEDNRGRRTPETVDAPQLRVVVDGAQPEIRLEAGPGPAGAIVLRYDVRDVQLAAESFRIEAREGAGPWRGVQVGPPDVSRGNRLAGHVTWARAASGSGVEFRATVSDRAGNSAVAITTGRADRTPDAISADGPVLTPHDPRDADADNAPPSLPNTFLPSDANLPNGPSLDGPTLDGPALGPAASYRSGRSGDPFGGPTPAFDRAAAASPSIASAGAQEWPASNAVNAGNAAATRGGSTQFHGETFGGGGGANVADRPAPPLNNSYAAADAAPPQPTWARTAGGGLATADSSESQPVRRGDRTVFAGDPFAASDRSTVGEAASRPIFAAPTLPPAQSNPFFNASTAAAQGAAAGPADREWLGNSRGPHGELPPGTMMVNTRTFDVDYDVNTAGDWGVARVELWGTSDNGDTWSSFAVDPDSRSPLRVTTPGAGLFGMRIVVHGANAAAVPPPAAGARPEMFVYVDLYPPSVNLLGAERGTGDAADQLRIRWTASDSLLAERPVTILYSSYESGPWSTAAANLENTGEFHWRLQRHLPERLFLRIEAVDQAGNVGVAVSPQPVHIEAPQPVGRLRGVRATESMGSSTSPFSG